MVSKLMVKNKAKKDGTHRPKTFIVSFAYLQD